MLYVNEIDRLVEEQVEQQDDWFYNLDIEEEETPYLQMLQDQAY